MGMTMQGWILDEQQAELLERDPDRVGEVLFGGDDPDDDRLEPAIDLDKAWHGLHFLLTGSEWETPPPLGLAVLGGRPVGDDLGYGPARLLEADEVRAVAGALAALDHGQLRQTWDPVQAAASGVYPTTIWEESDILDQYLLPNLRDLTAFYRTAADTARPVLLLIM